MKDVRTIDQIVEEDAMIDKGWEEFIAEQNNAEVDRRMQEDERLWWEIWDKIASEYPEADEEELADMTEYRWLIATGQL